MSLCVTYYKGGYTIDTNVFPTEKFVGNFPEYRNFKIVNIKSLGNSGHNYSELYKFNYFRKTKIVTDVMYAQKYNSLPPNNLKKWVDDNQECWLMYSPKQHSSVDCALNAYLSLFNLKTIKTNYTHLIISAIMTGVYSINNSIEINKSTTFTVNISIINEIASLVVDELNLEKIYYGTHK
ncbi:hypothetical protein [Silvanigrella sp.]|jgi:hypothetical protein|uniref:hypothetical protein n=1 Tax=Silvanigrella sp. TaxID=2024976 RepID=UPI0037CC089B